MLNLVFEEVAVYGFNVRQVYDFNAWFVKQGRFSVFPKGLVNFRQLFAKCRAGIDYRIRPTGYHAVVDRIYLVAQRVHTGIIIQYATALPVPHHMGNKIAGCLQLFFIVGILFQ